MHKKSYRKWCILLVKFLNRKQQAVDEVEGKCLYWRWRCRSRHLLKPTLACISVWAIIKQAMAECRRRAMANDAYCWQNSWTATSDWWIGRKASLLRCRLRHRSIIPLLFRTLEIKPWQMRVSSLPCLCISDACCWKISWTATSNWWSGRKGFALEMKVQDKKSLLHWHYQHISLFETFESKKPWQMRGKRSITSSGTWWHGWRAALSRFHCLHAFEKFGKISLQHCTFIRLPESTSDARRSTSLLWGRCRLS